MQPKTVLLTGASSGIGRAIALEYARRGAHVMAAARRETELLALVEEIRAAGGAASHLVCDVADARAAYELAPKAERVLGSLDMVIANAGVGGSAHASRLALDDLGRMMDINVRGAMATLAGAIPIMMANKGGQLVGVTSLAGRRALPGSAPYSASKAALSTFLEGLRIDLTAAGVHVSDVQPGFVDTALTKKNQFPMPFMWSAEKAARVVADRLERGPRIVAFPLPLALLTRLAQLLPFPLYSFITRATSGR